MTELIAFAQASLPDLAVVIVFGLLIVAGRRLGGSAEVSLFPDWGRVDRPRGVQEEDLPRFVFSRAN